MSVAFAAPPVAHAAPWMIGAAALVLAGCAGYEPRPATPDAIDAALRPSAAGMLRVAAADLRHPTLWPIALPDDGTLTPRAAAVVAVVQHPSLRAVRDRRGVAAAQVLQAGLLPNPDLSANLDIPSFGNTQGTVNGYGVGIAWDATSLLTLRASREAARLGAGQVDLDIAWEEWQVALAAELHASRVLWLARQVDLTRRAESDAGGQLRALEGGVAAGFTTSIERDAAGAVAQRFTGARVAAEAALAAERELLDQSLGLPPGAAVEVVEPQAGGPVPSAPAAADIAGVIDRRLDIMALRLGYASQEARLRGAVLSQFPRINIGITRARDTSNVGTIGLGVTIELPIFDRGQGRIAAEKATRGQLFDELASRTFDGRADAAHAWRELSGIGPQIDAADEAVTRLDRLDASLTRALREGLSDAPALYQVRSDLADARIAALQLRQQKDELRIAVEAATGALLD